MSNKETVNLVKHTGGCHYDAIRFKIIASKIVEADDCMYFYDYNYV